MENTYTQTITLSAQAYIGDETTSLLLDIAEALGFDTTDYRKHQSEKPRYINDCISIDRQITIKEEGEVMYREIRLQIDLSPLSDTMILLDYG